MTDITDRFRSSTWGWLRGTLAGWGTLLLLVGGFGGMVVASVTGMDIPLWTPLIVSALALAIIAWQWLENVATIYEVAGDRLILRRGIFVKSIDEIELYRVKDVRLDFTLINQMAGIGDYWDHVERRDNRQRPANDAARRKGAATPRRIAGTGGGRPAKTPRARNRHDA